MAALRRLFTAVLFSVIIFAAQAYISAQDDESPEQKKLLETLEERARIAAGEKQDESGYIPYGYDLMVAKEYDRASMMKSEELDLTEEGEGYGPYGYGGRDYGSGGYSRGGGRR
jgi:hypothetical protein